jgi:hypothetical protein
MKSSVLSPQSSVARALLRQLLGALIVVGCVFLWIGLPVGALWLAGQLTEDAEVFLLIALGGIPLGMVGCGWLIYRLNGIYVDLHEDEEKPFPLMEVAMTASAVVALVLMVLWFFFLAEYRLVTPP